MYREDEKFRENAKKKARDNYRKKAWGDTEVTNPVRWNLSTLNQFGAIRKVDGTRCRTFTVPEIVQVLVRSVSIYRRWIALQQVPPPTYGTYDGPVYKLAEAEAIVTVLAGHFDQFGYYRQDHTHTKRSLWEHYWLVHK